MPYIELRYRPALNKAIKELTDVVREQATVYGGPGEYIDGKKLDGMVNFCITKIILELYGNADSTNYSQINSAQGVLKCVAEEHYRRVAVPYEDKKIIENGDV